MQHCPKATGCACSVPTHAAAQPGWSTALALPRSAFPLLQHFLLRSLPRTSTARWPDQALPSNHLWCVGRGADVLLLVPPKSSPTPLPLAQPRG